MWDLRYAGFIPEPERFFGGGHGNPFWEIYQQLQIWDDTMQMAESQEELNGLLMKGKDESEIVAESSTFKELLSPLGLITS